MSAAAPDAAATPAPAAAAAAEPVTTAAVTSVSPAAPATTAAATTTPPATTADENDPTVWDHDRGMATIKKLRQEVKDLKGAGATVAALEAKVLELERAQLSEQERIAAERDQFKSENESLKQREQTQALRLAVHELRDELGIADADLAIAGLDASQVEYDQAGAPTNLNELLTDLLERKPILKATPGTRRAPSADGGSGAGAGAQTASVKLTPEEVEAATELGVQPARYEAMKGVRNIDDFMRQREAEKAAGGAST